MIDSRHRWFSEARYGLFIHFGPYAAYGRGEQVLFREHLDQHEYERAACRWKPTAFDARAWAQVAVEGGFRYAVFTTRHHDGYCLWNCGLTDYNSMRQAARRDFVHEYVEAFRDAGLRVGLYYSFADWRVPAYWRNPEDDPAEWVDFRDYVHGQVEELLTNYGRIDVFWFDGAWPHGAERWDSINLMQRMRQWQPDIMINNRADATDGYHGAVENSGDSPTLGDFGTPEHQIIADPFRQWESCQVSTQRLWGYAIGERWRDTETLLDFLCESASIGGNLLLNVGPDAEGRFPPTFIERTNRIGTWLKVHGEAIYGTGRNVTEFVTYGYQTTRENHLYLIIRFWDGRPTLRLAGLATRIRSVKMLCTDQNLAFRQTDSELVIEGLPTRKPCDLHPVIRLDCDGAPRALPWAHGRLWAVDPRLMVAWAAARGNSVLVGSSRVRFGQ